VLQEGGPLMNPELTKYLTDVLRNDIRGTDSLEPKKNNLQSDAYLIDRNIDQFIFDKKYSLRLDEII
jgi:hypothetical protein